MKKFFLIMCVIVVLSVISMVVLVLVNNDTSDNTLVCQSDNGSITLTYNNETIIGYSANGYDYDFFSAVNRINQIGIDRYLEEFSDTFNNDTFGTCN